MEGERKQGIPFFILEIETAVGTFVEFYESMEALSRADEQLRRRGVPRSRICQWSGAEFGPFAPWEIVSSSVLWGEWPNARAAMKVLIAGRQQRRAA